ncbi:carboxymuconolactone decarboxylase family protein [Glaciimonas sp. PCH181]|uniref:carboxymuconolactone decarboxylase family protein n=1 Tax=Glaciimonas sp. PCH181 TaxID=2133943 RepID=UPI000D38404A|nr:carboxymuconolactone decarboxylase family protein [Glaciimonas sp. PCH181]PUA17807.1 alkylhydroperoxidase [Glaciimonas sp. PCH181]
MSRIPALTLAQVDPATAITLTAVKSKLGRIPNAIATLAQAPAALNSYLAMSEALSKGRLSARQTQIIALAVGQANSCQYCLSAHTLMGKAAGLSGEEILAARAGHATAAADDALAAFAVKVVEQRGVLSNEEVDAARAAGLDDGLIIETIASVVFNILTNYTNHIAATDVDFPAVATAL